MQNGPHTIEDRMQSFVAQLGNLPAGARRLHDFDAHRHWAKWIQRVLGKGLACSYVIGYAYEHQWWTWCFERRPARDDAECELWSVEAYDSSGRSSSGTYCFVPRSAEWGRSAVCPTEPSEYAIPARP